MSTATRRHSTPVRVGHVTVGGGHPVVVQSMTNTDTADVEATALQVRALATAAQGQDFDLREFHDVVLGSGAIPLDVLEGNVKRWIDGRAHAAQDTP